MEWGGLETEEGPPHFHMAMSVDQFIGNPKVPRAVIVRRPQVSQKKSQIFYKVIESGSRGITADELEIRLKLRASTVSSALNAMVKDKMIYVSGEYRPTRSGRRARVYVRRK